MNLIRTSFLLSKKNLSDPNENKYGSLDSEYKRLVKYFPYLEVKKEDITAEKLTWFDDDIFISLLEKDNEAKKMLKRIKKLDASDALAIIDNGHFYRVSRPQDCKGAKIGTHVITFRADSLDDINF